MIKKIKNYIPHLLILCSVLLCGAGFKVFLIQTSRQIIQNFQAQNLSELNASDVFSLGTKLNSLSNTIHWVCIKGTNKGNIFYEKSKGFCGKFPWQEIITIKSLQNTEVEIIMTVRLSKYLELMFVSFVILQLLLLIGIFNTAKKHQTESLKMQASLGQLAAQVAHDIKSPLAALTAIQKDLATLPETSRILIRSAMDRIRNIATDLINKNRELTSKNLKNSQNIFLASNKKKDSVTFTKTKPATLEHLLSLMETIVSEKRIQYGANRKVEIKTQFLEDSFSLFSTINATELKRILSNLINNSVEAMETNVEITIALTKENDFAVITIKDTGKGIPKELLEKLGTRGETHGKQSGSGLGLYHAKSTVESWSGSLEIMSQANKGTQISIRLKTSKPPKWFLSELTLTKDTEIVITDDDENIHHIWNKKFENNMGHEIKNIYHLSNPSELREWFKNIKTDKLNLIKFLIDFEYVNSKETGLDIIHELGINTQSTLVTSRAEEELIRTQCESIEVTLLSKNLAHLIPVGITHS